MPNTNLAENILKERRVTNIANTSTNLLIWVIDTVLVLAMLAANNFVDMDSSSFSLVGLTYLFLTNVISPCLYFIGMPASKKTWIWPILMNFLG